MTAGAQTAWHRAPGVQAAAAGLVLLLALALRLWDIGFDLPEVHRGIEDREVVRAMELGAGQFNWTRFRKGGLFYVLFAEYGAYYAGLRLTGAVGGGEDFALRYLRDPSPFFLMGRVTVALMGTATVWLLYLIGRRAFGAGAGLLAALGLAVNPVHVQFSHYICVDVPMLLFVATALYLTLRVTETGALRHYVLGGLAVAAAGLCKIPGLVAAVPFGLAHLWRARTEGGGLAGVVADRRILLGVGALVALYVVGAPGVLLLPGKLLADTFSELAMGQNSTNAYSGLTPDLWWVYARDVFRTLGPPLALLGAYGVVRAVFRRDVFGRLLAAFAVVFYVALCLARFREWASYYALPLMAALLILAGREAMPLVGRLARGRARVPAALGLAAVLAAWPAYGAAHVVRSFGLTDTRTAARVWIEAHIPPGAKILVHGVSDRTNTQLVKLNNTRANYLALAAEAKAEHKALKARYFRVAAEAGLAPAYDLVVVHTRRTLWEPLAAYRARGIEYIILDTRYFDAEEDIQYTEQLNESRRRFYAELISDPGVERVARFEPLAEERGPTLEIFRIAG